MKPAYQWQMMTKDTRNDSNYLYTKCTVREKKKIKQEVNLIRHVTVCDSNGRQRTLKALDREGLIKSGPCCRLWKVWKRMGRVFHLPAGNIMEDLPNPNDLPVTMCPF